MKDFVDKTVQELSTNTKVKKFEVHAFPSGAYMIDIWVRKEFYCIQLSENTFGISHVSKDVDFSTTPDETYSSFKEFIVNLLYIISTAPKNRSKSEQDVYKKQSKTKKKKSIWQRICDLDVLGWID
jgi:hypothetical protein